MKKIFTLLLVALTTVASMSAADKLAYNITYAGNGKTGAQASTKLDKNKWFQDTTVSANQTVYYWSDTTAFSEGLDKIDTTATKIDSIYNYTTELGVKYGTGSHFGYTNYVLQPAAQVPATKIVLTASAYYTDYKNGMRGSFVVNGVSTDTIASTDNAEYTIALNGEALKAINISMLTLDKGKKGTVCRLNLKNIAVYVADTETAVAEVTAAKQVKSVSYYNLAGQQSAVPFEGINVVRTTYTDGTASVKKMMH